MHGDYRPANILVVDGQLSAVLDWEFAHVGDPAEDLGWYLTSHYTHEHLIEGNWSADDFIAVYVQALGAKVDRQAIRFWAVFRLYKLASLRLLLCSCLDALGAHDPGGSSALRREITERLLSLRAPATGNA